jgi:hypothetical protein
MAIIGFHSLNKPKVLNKCHGVEIFLFFNKYWDGLVQNFSKSVFLNTEEGTSFYTFILASSSHACFILPLAFFSISSSLTVFNRDAHRDKYVVK